jgi:diguanylate cyclase (GGDEF)-like protein
MRLRLQRSLTASAIYVFSLTALWYSALLGQVQLAAVQWLTGFMAVGMVLIYALIRSGLSLRLPDPALTMPQMIFAIVSMAQAYYIFSLVRGMLLMLVAMVLVFGAFMLTPQRCRVLGWLSVALLSVAMLAGVVRHPEQFNPVVEAYHFVFSAVVLPTMSYLLGELSRLRIKQKLQRIELQQTLERMQQLATHDELTTLPNRRHVQQWMTHELARQQRRTTLLCMAIVDLDHFKHVNDHYGHATGDEVLRRFSRQSKAFLREGDVLARWGGEEFLLVMPATTLEQANEMLQRLRLQMQRPESWGGCSGTPVSFSAGLTAHADRESLEDTVNRADHALYEAKHQGRDRIISVAPPVLSPSDGVVPSA